MGVLNICRDDRPGRLYRCSVIDGPVRVLGAALVVG